MTRTVIWTSSFKKDYKLAIKKGLDISKLDEAIKLLSLDAKLPLHYKDHKLIGNFKNLRECHIEPDWLLLYFKEDTKVSLVLMRTGSHSDLFEK